MALAENPSRICFFLSSMSVLWVILSCSSYSADAALAPMTLENSVLSSLRLSGSDSGSWMEPAEKDTTRYAQSTFWKNNIRRIPDSDFFSAMARVPWKQLAERNGALRNSKRALGIEIPDMFINAKSPAAHSHSKSSLSMGIDLGGMRKLAAKLRGMGKCKVTKKFKSKCSVS